MCLSFVLDALLSLVVGNEEKGLALAAFCDPRSFRRGGDRLGYRISYTRITRLTKVLGSADEATKEQVFKKKTAHDHVYTWDRLILFCEREK
jgi:hypothetical protein